jgi:hypothetical protein
VITVDASGYEDDVLPGEAFVMPGPYAPRVQVDATLDQLRDWLG